MVTGEASSSQQMTVSSPLVSSPPTSCGTADVSSTTPIGDVALAKLMVEVNQTSTPVGGNHEKFVTRMGDLVRLYCPISYTDWRKIPQNYKEDVWNALMQQFEFNVPSHLVKHAAVKAFPQKMRTFKFELRKLLTGKVTMQENIDACPDKYNLDWWKGFIDNECKDGVHEKHVQAAENCKKRVVKHNCRRETYANKVYKLTKEDGMIAETGRGVGWMNGHVGKNGDINPSAVEAYEKVRDAREKRKPLIDAGLVSDLDFENDEIAEVFGADKSGTGLLGYSSHVSKKQALHASLATAVMDANINPTNNAQRHDNMDETQLIKHTELVTKIVLHAMANQLQKQPPANANLIPYVEIPDRCSNPCLVGVENPNNGIQVVHLFDRERRDVATGSVVYGKDGQYCHGLMVYSDERKIALETIVDPSCPLPHRPQADDRYHLTDYAPVEWVIWPVLRMEFIEV